jgi:enoyl-CoA hydratase/carnithine racemase
MEAVEAPELLVEERDDGIVLITLNRPRARNTVSFPMWERFSAALDRLENNTPARALVLCGADGHFSNGGDVKLPPARGEGTLALAARLEMGQRIINRLRALPMPVIAAIEGGPFIQFGLVPDGGAAWFLTQRIGRARAAEIIFSGRTIEATEAFSLGLVSRTVPSGTAVAEALSFASAIGDGNRHAVELSKRLLHQSETGDLTGNNALELVYCHVCQAGEEVPRAREKFKAQAAARTVAKAATQNR